MLRRGVHRRHATTGLAVALGLGLAALTGSQEERPLLFYGHDSYRLLRGPEGVMWCPRQALPGLRVQSMLQLVDPFSLRQVALGHDGDAQPVLEVPFPVCNDNRLFTFSLGPDYRLYYADGLLDLREGMFPEGCFVRLYAYVSPAEVAAFTQDPSRCLPVTAANAPQPEVLYQRLLRSRFAQEALARAPDLSEEVAQLYAALLGPANPNERWATPAAEPERFADRLVQLLNQVIGDETQAVSLYRSSAYADTQLPVQIVEVLRGIHDLGGAYDGSSTDASGPGVPLPAADPWRRYRPPPKTEPPPSAPAPAPPPPAVIQQIRLLNRLLLEYELGGALQGTLYAWIKDLRGYRPVWAYLDPRRLVPDSDLGLWEAATWDYVMPMMVDPDRGVLLLLEPQPSGASATEAPAQPPGDQAFYVVGPWGELTGPLATQPGGETYVVRGRGLRWVPVEEAGQLPDPSF